MKVTFGLPFFMTDGSVEVTVMCRASGASDQGCQAISPASSNEIDTSAAARTSGDRRGDRDGSCAGDCREADMSVAYQPYAIANSGVGPAARCRVTTSSVWR